MKAPSSGVSKQMDGARDANGKLTPAFYAMRKEIQKAAREIPLTTVGITRMVEASLRMGVAREEVIGFTRSTAMMATAFEMAESEIADSMGKISNLYRIPITAINDTGGYDQLAGQQYGQQKQPDHRFSVACRGNGQWR